MPDKNRFYGNKIDDDLLTDCQQFIQLPGESGREEKAALFLKTTMERMNFDRVWIDSWGNVIGLIEGQGDFTVMMEGHLDTVGVENPDLWEYDPYAGLVEEEKLYGRGTSDMKCALMAMVHAAASLIPDKELLRGSIAVVGVVHEEDFEGVAQGKVLDQLNPDLVIIGEASNLRLCIGQRGRAEIQITTYGKSVHSSNPEQGINAVKKMVKLLQQIDRLELPTDNKLGRGIMELTDIHSYPYPGKSVLPEKCMVTFDRRLLPGETKGSILQPIESLINQLSKLDSSFKADVRIVAAEDNCYTGEKITAERFFPAWLFAEDQPFVEKARGAIRALGLNDTVSYYSFCTDGSQSAGLRKIPTLGFGPSSERMAHIVNEYIELEQLQRAYQGYRELIGVFLTGDGLDE